MSEEKKCIVERAFDKLFDMTDEGFKKSKKALTEKKLKREFNAAWDETEGKKINTEDKIATLMRNVEHFDINEIIKQRQHIVACRMVQEEIEKIYEELFGCSLN